MDTISFANQIDSLKIRINELEQVKFQLDSLIQNQNLTTLQMKVNESADIISNVQSFYESAWLKLIIVITLLGIVIPILIQFFQKNTLKSITDFLSKEIKDKFEEKLETLSLNNEERFTLLKANNEKEVNTLKNQIDKMSKEVDGNLLYLQGRDNRTNKFHARALKDFIRACKLMLDCSKTDRANILLININKEIIKIEHKNKFEKIISDLGIDIQGLITEMRNSSDYLIYRNNLDEVEKSISNLK